MTFSSLFLLISPAVVVAVYLYGVKGHSLKKIRRLRVYFKLALYAVVNERRVCRHHFNSLIYFSFIIKVP